MATINKTYMNLYENKNGDADVTFLVHRQEVMAHKNIVTAASETLKAMINSDLAPPDGRHRIDDEKIKVEDFKQFLKFLYLDECDIDYTNLGALLHIGQMYLLPTLKEKCKEFVRNQCKNIEGNIQCCEIGILCEDECPEIVKYSVNVLAQKNFGKHQISAKVIERIAKDCPRIGDTAEDTLFVKIFEWGKTECARRNIAVEKEEIKNVLSPFIKYMNLKDVSMHTWAHIIDPNELAPPEECHKHLADLVKSCSKLFLQITPKMLENGEDPHRNHEIMKVVESIKNS